MIAKPLMWVEQRNGDAHEANGYLAHLIFDGSVEPWGAFVKGTRIFPIGRFCNLHDAKAACECHHQVAYVRGLSKFARGALVDAAKFVPAIFGSAHAVTPAKWLAILDEADAADRSEQGAKP